MTRRALLRNVSLCGLGMLGLPAGGKSARWFQDPLSHFEGHDVLARILAKSAAENWKSLPIGELVGKVAMELQGIRYAGSTLELSVDRELCTVNLKGLDCVTFFEDSLDIARMIKRGKSSEQDLVAEVQFTRYRGGAMAGYTSRLHYTTDWIVDNETRGVVKNMTGALPGAQPFTQKVGIMSQHPEHYPQLVAHPEWVPDIRRAEDVINARALTYLPIDKLAAAEPLLQTGDIVGVTTVAEGIDIAHTGLCIRDDKGIVHFMDASSSRARMAVTLEPEISTCLNWSSKLTGVMIARPLEPKS